MMVDHLFYCQRKLATLHQHVDPAKRVAKGLSHQSMSKFLAVNHFSHGEISWLKKNKN
jgi:hypothetical protein